MDRYTNRQTKIRNDEMDGKTRFRNEYGTSNVQEIPAYDSDVDTHH